jgi:hypothetical protein
MARRFLSLSVLLFTIGCKADSSLTEDDFVDPVLEFTNPVAADWLPAGETTVTGRVEGLDDLQINGAPAEIDGDTFSATITLDRGINVIEASGTDGNDHTRFERASVIAGEFADPGRPVKEAVVARLNTSGIDFAMDMVGDMINDMDIEGAIAGANPVYEDTYGVWSWDAVYVRADIGSLDMGNIQLDANPEEAYLDLTVTIPWLDVWVPVYGDILGWDFDVDAWIWASSAEITGYVTVDVDNNDKLVADLHSPTVQLYGFGYDTSLLPGEIETYILVDTIREALEDMLVEQISEAVPPLIEEQLADLDLSFETELLDRDVAIEAGFTRATIDEKGIELITKIDVNMKGKGEATYAGYLAADEKYPKVSRSGDLSAAISDDMLNRVLFEAWRSGIMDIELSTEDGSLAPEMLMALKATTGTVKVHADLPPVIVEHDKNIQLQAGEIIVDIYTPNGAMGDHVQLSIAVYGDIDLEVKKNKLKLDLQTPELIITVRDTDWGRSGSDEAVNLLLDNSFGIESLLGLLGDMSFDLPTIGDVNIADAQVDRNKNGVYTDINIELN